eukprot:2123484-Rhodomonas_salina.1
MRIKTSFHGCGSALRLLTSQHVQRVQLRTAPQRLPKLLEPRAVERVVVDVELEERGLGAD